ncbi:MAG TPA: hypothetical protein PK225_03475 [Azonexus sp.]|jgi:hypothetical protein|nr:hypothetical protein [Azonexus sp.]
MRSLAPITIILLAGLAGCAFFPNWHWEKRGAATGDYDQDVTFCKQRTYSGVDGMVTDESVRRMHGCMEAKGWRKVQN